MCRTVPDGRGGLRIRHDRPRTSTVIGACLHAAGITVRAITTPRSSPLAVASSPPSAVLLVPRFPVAIWIYPGRQTATRAFSRAQVNLAVLQHNNVVLELPGGQTAATAVGHVTKCAFGAGARPTRGQVITDLSHPRSGRALVERTDVWRAIASARKATSDPGRT